MPSKTDFNVSPYYDDYDEAKKFHRVMYRPAFAVQARELTTQQSITQNQIEKMGDHMFKHGAMVIPGETEVDLNYQSVKLTSFTGTLVNLFGSTVTGGTSGMTAKVVNVIATDGTDPDTLFVKYQNGGTDNATHFFTDGETLTSDASGGETAVVSTVAIGAAVHILDGTYYINGYFVNVSAQTLILDKYTRQPTCRVGLTIVEDFITSTDDTSLLDNATGTSNANATGAHRFKIELILTKLSIKSTADANFVELITINNGVINNKVNVTTYNLLENTLARRTHDESGDYAVESFDIDVRESLNDLTNNGIYTSGEMTNAGRLAGDELLAIGMGAGVAYVKGFEVRKVGTSFVDLFKARDFQTDSGITTRFAQLPFVNITDMFGTPDIGLVADETESYKKVRLLDTEHTTRGTVLTNNDGKVFDIGRAKTRGIEYNSGTATGVFMSSASVTTNTYKQYLFDTVMFAHLNVLGAASGALTTGETLTGGTSGATGIVESITSLGAATITGVTAANPAVVTCSGGHNFTEGQQITIASVSGMTDINANHTVKNPTATTLELHAVATSTNSKPLAIDTTGSTAYSSGGTVAHTIVILSDVNGEFSVGETATGGTSSNTVVVQFDAFGCKGFEQKQFAQTKGVSGASSPAFTADVDLTSTFGDEKTLTGTISTVDAGISEGSIVMDGTDANGLNAGDSIILEDGTETGSDINAIGLEGDVSTADRLFGSGTKFKDELKIGDQISFEDDANTTVTRVIQSISSNSEMETALGLGSAVATRVLFKRQRTKINSPENNTSLFKLPYEVVKTLLTADNSEISDTSFKIRRQFVSSLSSSGTATLTAGTNEIFSTHSENDVTVSVMAKGGSATAGEVGDVITLAGSGDYTLGGSPTGKTLAIDLGSTFNGSKIKILATVSASVVGAKTKTKTDATTTFDTAALSAPTKLNLGYADVFKVSSVHMAADFSTVATTADTDITSRFNLDTGQRDNFYDISRIVRIPGEAAPTGRLLITFEYYEHGAGNFFSVDSYSGVDYITIPKYTSDVSGETFTLGDCLDFRPRVDNASTINAGDGQDRQYSGTGASTIEFPKFNSDITNDLEAYLARKARVFMMSNGKFQIQEGDSSLDPQYPEILADGMHLYDLFLPAYTFDPSDVIIKKVDNRRYTMRDIGRLEQRIESVEYYTQLSLLESDAQNMQIQDADGFDRFKNGIIVDNFTGHGIGDTTDNDYSVSMDMAQGELRPAFSMDNAALSEIDSDLATTITDTARATLGYQKTGDLITLPYSTASYIEQPYASTTVNLNPFDTISFIGSMKLTPDSDEWFATLLRPAFVHHIPGTYDTMLKESAKGVIDLNLGTVWNSWNDSWSGALQDTNKQVSSSATSGNIKTTTTTISTTQRVGRARSGIRTSLIPNEVRTSIADKVLSTSFTPFIRPKSIEFTAVGMKPNTRVYAFFDGLDVNEDVTPLGSSAGAALTTDSNGKIQGTFLIPTPTKITGDMKTLSFQGSEVTNWEFGGSKLFRTGRRTFRLTSNVENSLTGDIFTTAESDYIAKGINKTVQPQIVSTKEGQIVQKVVSENTVVDRPGSRQTVTENRIQAQQPANDPPQSDRPEKVPGGLGGKGAIKVGSKYKSGNPTIAKKEGFIVDVVDQHYDRNKAEPVVSVVGTKNEKISSTPQGSAAYVQIQAKADFDSGTPIREVVAKVEKTVVKSTYGPPNKIFVYNPPKMNSWQKAMNCRYFDPVAQSFLIDTPGGIFIPSIDLFFATKSTTLPVTVQLRTMINGFPTREIIPFGEVSVDAADINVSSTGETATTFTFDSPVYLQEGEEYAFVALSNTDEYTIYTARMGQKTLDDSRLISKQPYLGSMFKSQNARTWTPEQNEDIKFDIKRCAFTTDTIGNVYFVNSELPVHTLAKINPISTTASSGVITIHHRNHGMHSTSANVTIAGVPSGTHNGIASTNINGTYTSIGNIKLDSYTVTAKNSDTATATGDVGGTNTVTATRNMLFDVIQPVVGSVTHERTSLNAQMRTTGGRTLEGGEAEYTLETAAQRKPVVLNADYYMTKPGMIASGINETNEMGGSKSFTMNFGLYTPDTNDNLSPVIDTKRMSLHLIQNRLNNPLSGTTPDFVAETTNQGGSSAAKYITKPVVLENLTTALDIRLSANIRTSSSVKMYYRVSTADDVRKLGDIAWRGFNDDGSTDASVTPATDNVTFREQQFSVKDLPEFTAFQLKIVMTGTNSSYPPLVKDMRGIALAV